MRTFECIFVKQWDESKEAAERAEVAEAYQYLVLITGGDCRLQAKGKPRLYIQWGVDSAALAGIKTLHRLMYDAIVRVDPNANLFEN